jgi:hypothetical protein
VPAGYSRRRLVEKLDLKRGSKAYLRGAPHGYAALLGTLPPGVVVRRALRPGLDFIQGRGVRGRRGVVRAEADVPPLGPRGPWRSTGMRGGLR